MVATNATTISSWLVIGAGALLLGSALAMAAPLDFYDRRKGWRRGMERAGRMLAFFGAVAVFCGAVDELHGQHLEVAAAILFLVITALSALLLLPVFIRGGPRPEDEDGKERHTGKGHGVTFTVSVHGSINTHGDESGSPQNGNANPHRVADSQRKPHVK